MTSKLRIGPGWFRVQCTRGLHAIPQQGFFLISARLPRGHDRYQTTPFLGSALSSSSDWPSPSRDAHNTGRCRSGTATDTTWMPPAVVPARNGPGLTHGGLAVRPVLRHPPCEGLVDALCSLPCMFRCCSGMTLQCVPTLPWIPKLGRFPGIHP